MGVVYRARRGDDAFEQTVALKILRSEKLHGDAHTRFARERRILARFSHPHIAHLIDGGLDPQGHPWIALEYIDGVPLMDWCNARRLCVTDRVHLLLDLCEAVEYAHRHSVVHRDIKSNNVLVDAGGTVKLLDFGIAKLLDEGDADTAATDTRARLLTPVSAAPEQIRGEKVTTATDVHALGLLLYELLCGHKAYGGRAVLQLDLLREILERDAPSMAARLTSAADPAAEEIANDRGVSVRTLQRLLRGDLHHIVAKALRKEPEARYRTVAEFSDDLRRYLADEAVCAVEGARTYRLRKFVAQHRIGVALAAAALLALLVVLVSMAWLGRELRRQAQRADQQSRTAVATRDFLIDLFKSASPERTLGNVPDALELVDIGRQRIDSDLQAQPELQAQLLGTIGGLYVNLGRYDAALDTLARARGLSAIASGDRSAATARLDLDIAHATYLAHRNSDPVRPLLDRIIATQRDLPPGQRSLLVPALTKLGLLEVDRSRYPQAESLLREAVDLARAQGEPGQRQLKDALLALSEAVSLGPRSSESVDLLREAAVISARTLPAADPERAHLHLSLAAALAVNGRLAEGEAMLREIVASQKRVLGERHPQYAVSLFTLADVLARARKLDEAETLFVHALAIATDVDKTGDVMLLCLRRLAFVKQQQGAVAAALPYAERAMRLGTERYGSDDQRTLDAGLVLTDVLLRLGQYAKAEATAREVHARTERMAMPLMASLASIRLGQVLRAQGRAADAAAHLRAAIAALNTSRGEHNLDSLTAILELAKAERDMGRVEAAREQAQRAAAYAPAALPAGDVRIVQARALAAQADYLQDRCGASSLADLEALRSQLEREAPAAREAIAGAALIAGLCRRRMQPGTTPDARNEALIRDSAQATLQAAATDPFYRAAARKALGMER
ncbi:MAG TPA: serine/threonine-protein kinase [Dokdonella sp.]|uniref:serine/threonine-protein kinase n=1 Tax=Dokdonella sp. TaxID=2291710 RepID=UPI002B5B33F1|nr:serine/threonine-protein kinase [Dokdonella sp.]HUD43460.1 serine/threonine-protein kinase [Dokdonella sp.]